MSDREQEQANARLPDELQVRVTGIRVGYHHFDLIRVLLCRTFQGTHFHRVHAFLRLSISTKLGKVHGQKLL